MSPLSKDETRHDSSLTLMISHYTVIKTMFLLAVRMAADVTETRNVIPSLEFKTCIIIKPKSLFMNQQKKNFIKIYQKNYAFNNKQ